MRFRLRLKEPRLGGHLSQAPQEKLNRPAKMNDNAHMESFFHSMKTEGLYGKAFTDDQQLRQTLNSYIAFYNQQRLHSSLRYLPPASFERQQAKQACVN